MEPLLENNKIYVGGLPEEVTENSLSEPFEKYGQVVKATVAVETGKPKDFGFVWFADEDSAKAAIGDVEEHVILGKKVEVKEAIRRERSTIQDNEGDKCPNCEIIRNAPRLNSKKIFVGGLPTELTEVEFKSFFESFGKTTDVVIIVDTASRRSRGFGFVTYESDESARAVLRTNRYVIHGKEVEVKVAIPKEEVANTTGHPNVHPQGQHHPSAGVNGYHHDSSSLPRSSTIGGPTYEIKVEIPKEVANMAEHPNVPPQGQHHPFAGINGYHHDSSSWSRSSMIGGLTYVNSAPIYPYANGMVAISPTYAYGMAAPSTAYAVNGFNGYNGTARTASNGCSVAPMPFTKIRISKPPGINDEDSSACSSSVSNLDYRPSPSAVNHRKYKASSSENVQNDA